MWYPQDIKAFLVHQGASNEEIAAALAEVENIQRQSGVFAATRAELVQVLGSEERAENYEDMWEADERTSFVSPKPEFKHVFENSN